MTAFLKSGGGEMEEEGGVFEVVIRIGEISSCIPTRHSLTSLCRNRPQ